MTATTDESAFAAENVFGKGEPNTAYAQYFTGDSFLNNLVTDPECVGGVHNVSLTPGVVVFTRAGVKHWHGAKADSWFSHIALGVPGENASNEWLEPVDDAHYAAL